MRQKNQEEMKKKTKKAQAGSKIPAKLGPKPAGRDTVISLVSKAPPVRMSTPSTKKK
jgi:hypothetical protein